LILIFHIGDPKKFRPQLQIGIYSQIDEISDKFPRRATAAVVSDQLNNTLSTSDAIIVNAKKNLLADLPDAPNLVRTIRAFLAKNMVYAPKHSIGFVGIDKSRSPLGKISPISQAGGRMPVRSGNMGIKPIGSASLHLCKNGEVFPWQQCL